MAAGTTVRHCTVVLHDDHVSQKDMLGGTEVLSVGSIARLSAADAKTIVVLSQGRAAGQRDVSLHVRLGTEYGFKNRTPGKVSMIENEDEVTATHFELFFRDQNLTRADMWILTKQLDGQIIYKGSQVSYMGEATATVRAIYSSGVEVDSALYQQSKTKAILRSGSARYTFLVEISREMLHSRNDGELMYETLIEGYLATLFRRWETDRVKHQVSVVLFGRKVGSTDSSDASTSNDFFRVLHLGVPSSQWQEILLSLKRAFNLSRFSRQVSLAANGNLLDAIHLAAIDFLEGDESPRLKSTGTSIIAITAGVGFFDVEYRMLKQTTQLLLGHSIGVDIVSLSSRPSHPVPLFRYTLGKNEEFALPHWTDISYWPSECGRSTAAQWDLLGGGNMIEDVAIPPLHEGQPDVVSSASLIAMDQWDESTFESSVFRTSRNSTVGMTALESTPIGSNETMRASRLLEEQQSAATAKYQPLRRQASASSVSTAFSQSTQAKATTPVILPNRKISVGPRGLGLMKGGASTTISTTHASHGRDLPISPNFPPNEASSGLAKQIRASLNRKSSEQSLDSQRSGLGPKATLPIDIQSTQSASIDEALNDHTPTTAVEATSPSSRASKPSPSLSLTPTPFGGLHSSPEKHRLDPGEQAVTPWLTLLKPCNLGRENMRVASQYRQWQHVFPKAIDSGAFKWTSMCAPAALPLYNDLYPSPEDLKRYYRKNLRRLIVSQDEGDGRRAHDLLEQLIVLRLARGFQLVASPEGVGQSQTFMSIGADYHELQCLSNVELQIVEYTHRPLESIPTSPLAVNTQYEVTSLYGCLRTKTHFSFDTEEARVDWADLDQRSESHSTEDSLFRMRLVLLPDDTSIVDTGSGIMNRDLSDEEKRIDGIQRLTQQWQRHRLFSAEDQSHQVSLARRKAAGGEEESDQNPLAIEYHTRDPSALVNSQEPGVTGQLLDGSVPTPLFSESERYHSSNFDIVKLVRQMQEPPSHGVEVRDRRWLAKLHLKCFRGDEMTNWLLGAFKDLSSREDAVDMGNELMDRGIFTHVRHKHAFRDGNYFYQIAAAHRAYEYPDTASVFNRGSGRSVPPTPSSESRMSPLVRPARGDSDSSGRDSTADKKQVLLSQVLRHNMDQGRKSEHVQVVNLHYGKSSTLDAWHSCDLIARRSHSQPG